MNLEGIILSAINQLKKIPQDFPYERCLERSTPERKKVEQWLPGVGGGGGGGSAESPFSGCGISAEGDAFSERKVKG